MPLSRVPGSVGSVVPALFEISIELIKAIACWCCYSLPSLWLVQRLQLCGAVTVTYQNIRATIPFKEGYESKVPEVQV